MSAARRQHRRAGHQRSDARRRRSARPAARRRARRRGRADRLGRAAARGAGRRPPPRRRRRARSSPASSTATPTWSSPATGRPSSPPGWPASRTPAAASAPRSPPPGPPPTTSCAANVARLRREALRQGTTTIEIKSGYGLSTPDEARSLRIAARVHRRDHVPRRARGAGRRRRRTRTPTWSAARCSTAAAPYARWVDVFCERGAFDADQSRAVLTAGIAAGLLPRIHANQLTAGGGVQLAVELDAPAPTTAPTCPPPTSTRWPARRPSRRCCPGAEFSTRSPYPDARALLDAGATVALATDCNPGSSYTSSMPFCLALAVREMRMTPAEALWSATAGGAQALRRTDIGHLGVGARADLAHPRRTVLPAPGLPAGRAADLNRPAQWGARTMTRHRPPAPASPPPTSSPSPAAPPASRSRRTRVAAMATQPGDRRRHRAPGPARSTACPPASARSPTRSSRRSAGPSCSTR